MKQIKIKPLFIFDTPKGVVDNPNNPKTDINEFLDNQYKPEKYQQAIILYETGKATLAIPFLTNNKMSLTVCPNPIHIYFSTAYSFHQKAEEIRIKFPNESNVNGFIEIPTNLFQPFIQYKFSSIILLHTSLEAFINSVIPENASYDKEVKENGKKIIKSLAKEQIERLGFDEKYKKIIKTKTILNFDFQKVNQKSYDHILSFTKLRDNIIHLKTISDGNKNHYFKIFNEVIHADLNFSFESVKIFMNSLKTNFIE